METKNIDLGSLTAIELRNRINNCTTAEQLHECQKMRLNWIKELKPSIEAREKMGIYFDRKSHLVNYQEFLQTQLNKS